MPIPAVGSVALPAALRLLRFGATTVVCSLLFVATIGAGAAGGTASLAVDVLRRRLAVNRGARRRRFVAVAALGLAVSVAATAPESEVCVLLVSLSAGA